MIKWTEETIRLAAKTVQDRSSFLKKYPGAVDATYRRFPKLLNELFPPLVRKWTRSDLVREASKYQTKVDFVTGSRSAYFTLIARYPGLIDTLFTNQTRRWCLGSALSEIVKYRTISEFQIKGNSAYKWLRRNSPAAIGVFLAESNRRNTRDVIYIWRVNLAQPIYKIGVTSETLGNTRLRRVMLGSGYRDAVPVLISRIGKLRAHIVERFVKSLGEKVMFDKKFDGSTEFRLLTDDELEIAKGVISLCGESE